MSDQARLFARSPEDLVAEAKERWQPIKTFCMFSGGNDSSVVAHRCREHYDALYHIDTGTGVEEGRPDLSVIAHVQRTAAELGKPLVIVPAGTAYERLVLGAPGWAREFYARYRRRGEGAQAFVERTSALPTKAKRMAMGVHLAPRGFPGPGRHGAAYDRLKGRQTEELLRRTKEGHSARASVLFLSGIYSDESQRRATRSPLTEKGSAKFVNPLVDWTKGDFARYRVEHELRQSDVAALLHRSGECNCGAYAKAEEERAMLSGFCPRTFARIADLERRAEAAGVRWCRWGGYDVEGRRSNEVSDEEVGPECVQCALQTALEIAA